MKKAPIEAKMWEKNKSEPLPPAVSVEERNALIVRHYHSIVSKPEFKLGQKVMANELGEVVGILEPGQLAIVTEVGEKVAERCGDERRTVEMQTFGKEGKLERWNVDPRFLKAEKSKGEK